MLFTRIVTTKNGKIETTYFDSLAGGLRAVKAEIARDIKAATAKKVTFEIREMDVRVTCANFVRAVKGGFDTFKTSDHSGAVAGILDAIAAEKAEKAEKAKEAAENAKKAEKAEKATTTK